jgi:hypothetical protein
VERTPWSAARREPAGSPYDAILDRLRNTAAKRDAAAVVAAAGSGLATSDGVRSGAPITFVAATPAGS